MNKLKALSQKIGLGELLSEAVLQQGGSLHRIWHVHTTLGEYTFKKINSHNIQLLGERLLPTNEYLKVGRQCNAPDVTMINFDDSVWLTKPWVAGATQSNITLEQAKKIRAMLCAIHAQSIQCSAKKPRWGAVDLNKWQRVMARHNAPWVAMYQQHWSTIEQLNEFAEQVADCFTQDWVVSHRDISNSNVVWNESGDPVIIDWEFSGYINDQLDVYITAVNFDHEWGEIFEVIMQAYQGANPRSGETLFSGYCGYCFDWLDFNIDRLLYPAQQNDIAFFQLEVCMEQILKMHKNQ